MGGGGGGRWEAKREAKLRKERKEREAISKVNGEGAGEEGGEDSIERKREDAVSKATASDEFK